MKKRGLYFLPMILLTVQVLAGSADSTATRHWCIPDHIKIQFAGNIGFMSAGAGYGFAKNKFELDLMYGYVPPVYGGNLHTLTIKNTWIPIKSLYAGDRIKFDILTLGIPISYTFGKQFFFVPPKDQYPSRYYDYSSALRFGFFAGGKVHYELPGSCFREAGIYYELGTYDLLIHNYLFNKDSMRFGNLFSLALGVQFKLK